MSDTRSKILNAASQLFLQTGAQGLTVRAIAKQAGLSTIGIYSHFQGKQGILDALYIKGFELVSTAIKVEQEKLSPTDAILKACENYLESAQKNAAHYRLIFGEADAGYAPSQQAQAAGKAAFQELTELIAKLLPDDSSKDIQQAQAIRIWAIVHGYTSLSQHAVTQLVNMQEWKSQALDTVAGQLKLIKALNK